jgi:predicted dehydrogenase
LTAVLQRGPLHGVLIDAPALIHQIRARAVHDPRLYDTWLVADTIHAIDLFRCVGGEVTEIQTMKASWTDKCGDSFTAILRLSRGCLGTFVAHLHSGEEWSITLYGQGIRAVISLFTMTGNIYLGSGEVQPIPVDPVDLNFKAGLFAQDSAFIRALAREERLAYPASDLADATKTMRLIEQIGQY